MSNRDYGSGEIQMSIDTKKIAFLEEIEANNKSHSGATLMDHLIGVHDILMGWDFSCGVVGVSQ